MAIKDKRAVYAGSQVQAAGILFVAKGTGCLLTILRSSNVVDPDCWCTPGGKIEIGETPDQAARREAFEEIGYDGPMQLERGYVWESDTLRFHNFIALVDTQFTPKLNWESQGYAWTLRPNIPSPTHYGVVALLEDTASQDVIHRLTF